MNTRWFWSLINNCFSIFVWSLRIKLCFTPGRNQTSSQGWAIKEMKISPWHASEASGGPGGGAPGGVQGAEPPGGGPGGGAPGS